MRQSHGSCPFGLEQTDHPLLVEEERDYFDPTCVGNGLLEKRTQLVVDRGSRPSSVYKTVEEKSVATGQKPNKLMLGKSVMLACAMAEQISKFATSIPGLTLNLNQYLRHQSPR